VRFTLAGWQSSQREGIELAGSLTTIVDATLGAGTLSDSITVAELSQLASGQNPFSKPLFEPISTGFWISIRNDNVVSLDQQYHP
jgi:hypothetical protein